MSSSHSTNLNKKNLSLKNIIFMSPLSRTKLNIPNLISETKRILTTGNNHIKNSSNVSNYKNKSNKILNEIYKNYSTNRQIQLNGNSNNKKSKKTKNYKNSISIISSPKISSLTKYSYKNKIQNKKLCSFTTGFPINNFFRKTHHSDEKKLKKNNLINDKITSFNSSYSSNLLNKIYSNSSNKQKKFKPKLKNELYQKRNKNSFSSNLNSLSSETFSAIIPSNNNIKSLYNSLNKKVNQKKNFIQNLKFFNKNFMNKFEKTLQTNIISTSHSTLTKIKKSLNSNLSNENEVIITKNIETPEELHFFYINILQNGKDIESKFEVSTSINN